LVYVAAVGWTTWRARTDVPAALIRLLVHRDPSDATLLGMLAAWALRMHTLKLTIMLVAVWLLMWARFCFPLARRDFATTPLVYRLVLLGAAVAVAVAAFQPSLRWEEVAASWSASLARGLAPPEPDAPYGPRLDASARAARTDRVCLCVHRLVAVVAVVSLIRVPAWSTWILLVLLVFNAFGWALHPGSVAGSAAMLTSALTETAGLSAPPALRPAGADGGVGSGSGGRTTAAAQRTATGVVNVALGALYVWGGLLPRVGPAGPAVFTAYAGAAAAAVLVVVGTERALAAAAPDLPDTPGQRRTAARGAAFALAMYMVMTVAVGVAARMQAHRFNTAATVLSRGPCQRGRGGQCVCVCAVGTRSGGRCMGACRADAPLGGKPTRRAPV
jgi:hypothetical protein